MDFQKQLDLYLRARFTLLVIFTIEEERAVQNIQSWCLNHSRSCLVWDLTGGLHWVASEETPVPVSKDPISVLETIEKHKNSAGSIFILKDFHDAWDNPQVKRKLRSTCQKLVHSNKQIIITMPSGHIPEELKDEALLLDLPLPTSNELDDELKNVITQLKVKTNLTPLGREKLLQAALGLTALQAQRAFIKACVMDGTLDDRGIDLITTEKKQILRENEALEFFPVSETPEDVGGLGVLKEWLRLRESAFSLEARQYGLPSPKGIALLGIPGTGKSLTAKMIGGLWRLPLLRLDVGSLFGSLVGESEERARRALKLAETIAPCILWIDEIEKALSHGGLDSGTSDRVFGSILTWMQEKQTSVFVVATANDISSIPPELLRKGRFDEIFFLDLPNTEERKEIFSVHLHKRHRLPQDYDTNRLATATEGFVGAEIEQVIVDAMYLAFNQNQREFTTADILTSIGNLVPLSVSQREKIDYLRRWLQEGRALSASETH
jgi:AAA+ superfamily predicted ATPase